MKTASIAQAVTPTPLADSTSGMTWRSPKPSLGFPYPAARYAADLIARVQLLFRQDHSFTAPPNFHVEKMLKLNGKVIGFAGLDSNQRRWVAFRGTSTSAEWRRDFEYMQVATQNKTFGARCHSGFCNVFEQLRPQLMLLPDLNNSTVFCGSQSGCGVGHTVLDGVWGDGVCVWVATGVQ